MIADETELREKLSQLTGEANKLAKKILGATMFKPEEAYAMCYFYNIHLTHKATQKTAIYCSTIGFYPVTPDNCAGWLKALIKDIFKTLGKEERDYWYEIKTINPLNKWEVFKI